MLGNFRKDPFEDISFGLISLTSVMEGGKIKLEGGGFASNGRDRKF